MTQHQRQQSPDSNTPGETTSWRWLGVAAATVCVAIGAAGLVVFSGNDPTGEADDQPRQPVEFEPYAATTDDDSSDQTRASGETAEDSSELARGDAERSDEPSLVEQMEEAGLEYRREEDPRYRDEDVIGRQVDGEEILEDTRGDAVSQNEARERAQRHLESIENADEEWERRIRQREAALDSRVFEPRRGEGSEPIPGVELNEEVQERLNAQLEDAAYPDDEYYYEDWEDEPWDGEEDGHYYYDDY